jgi:hypothetical protein
MDRICAYFQSLLDLRDGNVELPVELGGEVGGRNAIARPLEQRFPEQVPQTFQRVADRRLTDMKPVGRGADAARSRRSRQTHGSGQDIERLYIRIKFLSIGLMGGFIQIPRRTMPLGASGKWVCF